jgi:hypothetical protein
MSHVFKVESPFSAQNKTKHRIYEWKHSAHRTRRSKKYIKLTLEGVRA